nr:hypothetical protein [Tanacetum cinerariifolium]
DAVVATRDGIALHEQVVGRVAGGRRIRGRATDGDARKVARSRSAVGRDGIVGNLVVVGRIGQEHAHAIRSAARGAARSVDCQVGNGGVVGAVELHHRLLVDVG